MAVKPTIYVVNQTHNTSIDWLLYGMEEEGIPFEFMTSTKKNLIEAAFEIATKSPLSVGIAVNNEQTVLHYKHLPEQAPLFLIENNQESMLRLGKNAARLVKGIPFKLDC